MKKYLNLLLISVLLIIPFVIGCGTTAEEEAKKTMINFFQACSLKQTKQFHQLLNKDKFAEYLVEHMRKAAKDKGKTLPDFLFNELKKTFLKEPERGFFRAATPQQWQTTIKSLKVVEDPTATAQNPGRMMATANDVTNASFKMTFFLEKESSGWKIIGFYEKKQ